MTMEWLQVMTIAGATIGCCLYFRRETKAQLDKLEEHGRERDAEMKDFHSKMCVLEERYIQVMKEQSETRTLMFQRFLESTKK
jgi:hypothetical protein